MSNYNKSILLEGKMLFPKMENGVFTGCIAMKDEQQVLNQLDDAPFGAKVSSVEFDDEKLVGLNVKSFYKFPKYNFGGEEIQMQNDDIIHGSDVKVMVNIRDYDYKGKKGLTAYIQGLVILKEPKHQEVSFEAIMGR